MAGKITRILREYIFILSVVLSLIGIIVLIIGALGTFTTILTDVKMMNEDISMWSPYILAIGAIIFLFGIYYLYSYITNKRFVISELQTNKRSELVKKHLELRTAVKYLPKKYTIMLKEKEKEFKIK